MSFETAAYGAHRLWWRRPVPFSTGLSSRRRRAEEARIDALLEEGLRNHAFDDGTVHVLDKHIEARRDQYLQLLDTQQAARARRAALRVAKAAARAERRHSRLRVLEARLERVEQSFGSVDAVLRGGEAIDSARPRLGLVDGPRQLSGWALQPAVHAVDANLPAATVRPIS